MVLRKRYPHANLHGHPHAYFKYELTIDHSPKYKS